MPLSKATRNFNLALSWECKRRVKGYSCFKKIFHNVYSLRGCFCWKTVLLYYNMWCMMNDFSVEEKIFCSQNIFLGECSNFKCKYNVIIYITTHLKLHCQLFLLNPRYYQNGIWRKMFASAAPPRFLLKLTFYQ